MSTRITSLHIYPIKSCRGISVTEARVVPGGLEGDRRFMLVDESGVFATARKEPRLLLVGTQWGPNSLIVSAPEMPRLEMPRDYESAPGQKLKATVWRDSLEAWEVPEASAWFSRYLGKEIRLVYQNDAALRQANPERAEPGDLVSLADGYPILLANEASLQSLNEESSEPVTMDRFRPNVVVSGAPAYDEDYWAEMRLGAIPCVSPKLCDRCVMTTVDGVTGVKGKEPLRTLARTRRWHRAVWFATNVIPRATGLLRVGDLLEVGARRQHPRSAG